MRNFIISAAAAAALLFSFAPLAPAQKTGDAAKGKDVFEASCGVCHNADSDEKKIGPALKGLYKRATLKSGKKVTDENVLAVINAGGNGMPGFADTLSSDDKDNLIAYLHTL